MEYLERQLTKLDKLAIENFGISAYGPAISIEIYEGESGKGLFLSGTERILDIVRMSRDFQKNLPGYILWQKLISLLAIRLYIRKLKRLTAKIAAHPEADLTSKKINQIVTTLSEDSLTSRQDRIWQLLPESFHDLTEGSKVKIEQIIEKLLDGNISYLRQVFAPLFILGEVDDKFRQKLKRALSPLVSRYEIAQQAYFYVDPISAVQMATKEKNLDELISELEKWLMSCYSRFDRELIVSFLFLAQQKSGVSAKGLSREIFPVCLEILKDSPSFHSQLEASELMAQNWPSRAIEAITKFDWRRAAVLISSLERHKISKAALKSFKEAVKNWRNKCQQERSRLEKSPANQRFVRILQKRFTLPERIARALLKNPREMYVPVLSRYRAYDLEEAQEIGFEQTISGPEVVVTILKLLDPRPGEIVLDVGSGSGWLAALLDSLTTPDVKVISIERIPNLVRMAEINANYLGGHRIQFVGGDGSRGYSGIDKFDCIVATAGTKKVPEALKDQFKRIMIIPLGCQKPYEYQLTIFRRKEDGSIYTETGNKIRFVPMISG